MVSPALPRVFKLFGKKDIDSNNYGVLAVRELLLTLDPGQFVGSTSIKCLW